MNKRKGGRKKGVGDRYEAFSQIRSTSIIFNQIEIKGTDEGYNKINSSNDAIEPVCYIMLRM